MKSPRNIKEVQRLIGRITTSSRFMPKMAEKTKPIISLLKKTSCFSWDDRCETIFAELKDFLGSPPVIQKPIMSQPIIIYLSVSREAVSSVLVQDLKGEQRPVYFLSRTLQEAEVRYQMIEKVALALLMTARRMRAYFQSHLIIVKTDFPIAKILEKPDLAGRMIG